MDFPDGQNVQFPFLLQPNGIICSIFSRNDKISTACYLHREKIGLFATTQTSQAPGNVNGGGGGSYKICSVPSSSWSTGLVSWFEANLEEYLK